MEVFVLVGPSGTGKSFQAINVAKEKNIKYIIDDGLLIKGNKVLGGRSAKAEGTSMAAIKRAIFLKNDHREEVRKILQSERPKRILVLGTSDKMVKIITNTLGLGEIKEWIYIDNISSKDEIKLARKSRTKEGKHLIPVPTFEIKKDFSGYFLNPLKIFRGFGRGGRLYVEEGSVVRPTFSYRGKYYISNRVIEDLAHYVANKVIGIYKISHIKINSTNHGLIIELDIIMVYGNPILALAERLQEQVKMEIEEMTSFNILAINLTIRGLMVV